MTNTKKKILIITGARSEYGLMKNLLVKLRNASEIDLRLIVTGSHLLKKFGNTFNEIQKDGFKIDKYVNILKKSDTNLEILEAMSYALKKLSKVISEISPNLVVILGDRYEIFVAAQCCLLLSVPIAHIHGGELTEGAIDDVFRHGITKLSHLHFVAAPEYRSRVIQLGENPKSVFNVGSLGVESVKQFIKENTKNKNISKKKIFLITYHPETQNLSLILKSIKNILLALSLFNDTEMIFTFPNADQGNNVIINEVKKFVNEDKVKRKIVKSLGQNGYWKIMQKANLVIGNSSSGIIEAPIFKTPTINIGDRQKGRLMSETIINTNYEVKNIINAVRLGLSKDFRILIKKAKPKYLSNNTSDKIVDVIKKNDVKFQKKFFNINHDY